MADLYKFGVGVAGAVMRAVARFMIALMAFVMALLRLISRYSSSLQSANPSVGIFRDDGRIYGASSVNRRPQRGPYAFVWSPFAFGNFAAKSNHADGGEKSKSRRYTKILENLFLIEKISISFRFCVILISMIFHGRVAVLRNLPTGVSRPASYPADGRFMLHASGNLIPE